MPDVPIDVAGGEGWSDQMLRSLGLIVLRFSGLEFCAERLLYGFISESALGILLVAGQDMSWKLDRLRAVHAELDTSAVTEALRAWIDGAETLNARRNQLVHSVWTMGSDGSPIGFRPSRRGKWNMRAISVTASQLEELAVHMREGTAAAVKICSDLTGHPQWRGRPLDEAGTAGG